MAAGGAIVFLLRWEATSTSLLSVDFSTRRDAWSDGVHTPASSIRYLNGAFLQL
jgi:hypothetical protein